MSFTVATVNDDFTDEKTNLPRVAKQADVLLGQETKNTKVGKELSDKFGVHQNIHRVDQAGTAVVWNRKRGPPHRQRLRARRSSPTA